MFLLKKIISPLFFPAPLCVETLILGLIILWFTRRQKAGKTIASVGVGMLLIFSHPSISKILLRPLETQYPPLVLNSAHLRPEATGLRFIVVLGGGYSSDPRIPVTSQLGEETMVRLVEGIRLYKELPGSKLILSGGRLFDPVPQAEIMGKVAEAVGVSRQDIILESESKDTEEETQLIQPMVGKNPFILVTSAAFMPRSMALFKKLGMNPFASPTDYLANQTQEIDPYSLYPSGVGLLKAERAVHEYLGLAWAKLRGKT